VTIDWVQIATQALLVVLSPVAVGLIFGIDRKITAHMQNRVGPPIIQPFYDLIKLFGKRPMVMNNGQVVFAFACLILQAAALALFVSGGDLLVIFFVSGAGSVALVLGAFSAKSPYSYFGSQRELLQILAYEPVFLLVILLIGYDTGTFTVSALNTSLLPALSFALIALMVVLVIKLQKSPYDIATAHQEIVSGPYVEYSGPYLGITKLAHWFEVAILLGVFTLFFCNENHLLSIAGKVAIVAIAIFVTQILDNASARLTRERMVKFTLPFGILLVALNMAIVYLNTQGAF
jgi:ech hydrogenase subunit B